MRLHKLEFGIAHRGCVVNQMSKALPNVRFVCPGGFILPDGYADEILSLDRPSDADVVAVIDWLKGSSAIEELEMVERTDTSAVISILAKAEPPEGYCSQAVERNRCFRIGYEIQQGGVEQWIVGAEKLQYVESLVEDLKTMGDLKFSNVTQASWNELTRAVI